MSLTWYEEIRRVGRVGHVGRGCYENATRKHEETVSVEFKLKVARRVV